jgi:hypothetical protein
MALKLKQPNEIILRMGLNADGPMIKDFTKICYNKMYRYVPFSGDAQRIHLRENVEIGVDSITFKTGYARYQYYGIREDGSRKVKNYTTPGTGKYWDQLMMSVERDNIMEEMRKKYGGRK